MKVVNKSWKFIPAKRKGELPPGVVGFLEMELELESIGPCIITGFAVRNKNDGGKFGACPAKPGAKDPATGKVKYWDVFFPTTSAGRKALNDIMIAAVEGKPVETKTEAEDETTTFS